MHATNKNAIAQLYNQLKEATRASINVASRKSDEYQSPCITDQIVFFV